MPPFIPWERSAWKSLNMAICFYIDGSMNKHQRNFSLTMSMWLTKDWKTKHREEEVWPCLSSNILYQWNTESLQPFNHCSLCPFKLHHSSHPKRALGSMIDLCSFVHVIEFNLPFPMTLSQQIEAIAPLPFLHSLVHWIEEAPVISRNPYNVCGSLQLSFSVDKYPIDAIDLFCFPTASWHSYQIKLSNFWHIYSCFS